MLLKGLGVNFEIIANDDQEESYPPELDKKDIPVYLAKYKSSLYQNFLLSNTILITADTIVLVNNEILGKPVNETDAVEILKKLSGKKHEVLTGVCIKSVEKEVLFTAISEVYFRTLTIDEIEFYVKNFKPYDKAGAYGVQEWIGYVGIERIIGSYYNVMGLPTQRLFFELKEFVK